jgi:adenine-specific DNA-methyltransferase
MPTLDWLNRAEALTSSDKVPYRILEPVSEFFSPLPRAGEGPGEREGTSDNLLIQGDNLDALKALLPFYRGRVKCIFIDPPYNTKSAFEHYDDNLEHSQWLSMMYPRLVLLRELLAEDGSIWVTIDDNEGHYLKVLMDEVFGRQNFVATVLWRKNYSPKSTARHFSEDHDYVLVYAKSGTAWTPNLMPRTEKQDKAYRNADGDPRGPWKPGDLSARNYYSLGTYPITTPSGRTIEGPPNAMYWRVSEERLRQLDADNRIWWGRDGSNVPAIKRFLSEVKQGVVPQTWWTYEEVGHTQDAKREVVELFGDDVFGTPKPERLLQRIIHIATNPGDLVLDSFLGSGTTAAVAHKMRRRWIGIEMGEHAETHCVPRMQKVIAGEQGGISQAVNWQGGGGFRFLRLGEPMFHADGSIHESVRFNTLASFVWMQETGAPPPSPLAPLMELPGNRLSQQAGKSLLVPQAGEGNRTPLLGVHEGRAVYLLFNGILGDKRPQSGNVLTQEVLAAIRQICPFEGEKIIYGEACRLGEKRLAAEGITFKHIPYDVKAR